MLLQDLNYNQLIDIIDIPCKVRDKNHKRFTKGIFRKRIGYSSIHFLSNNARFFGNYPADMHDSNYRYGWYCTDSTNENVDALFKEFVIDIDKDKIDYGEL